MKEHALDHTHFWIEPGPVILVTTAHKGRMNVMTAGFHMMIQHDPPLIGLVIGPWDYSFKALKATKECVIAIPPVNLAKKVVEIGNCSGEDINKFETFELTAVSADKVKAPLIEECLANIECRVFDTRFVNRYQLFILKAVKVWTNPKLKEQRTFHHNGNGTFVVDGETINLKKKMVKWPEYLKFNKST
jgi:flavin reductase (DIM6/NTAB) family NADH-FMN oxidoreductase RutF